MMVRQWNGITLWEWLVKNHPWYSEGDVIAISPELMKELTLEWRKETGAPTDE